LASDDPPLPLAATAAGIRRSSRAEHEAGQLEDFILNAIGRQVFLRADASAGTAVVDLIPGIVPTVSAAGTKGRCCGRAYGRGCCCGRRRTRGGRGGNTMRNCRGPNFWDIAITRERRLRAWTTAELGTRINLVT
jgi:hypothetical protein